MSFIDGIKERAKKDLKTIVLPEAEDERTIRAAAEILSKKLAKLILLGNPDQIYADAKEYGVHVSDAVIVDPQNCGEKLDEYANNKDLIEEPIDIYISSSWYNWHYMWGIVDKSYEEMLDGKPSCLLAFDESIAIRHNLKTMNYFRSEKKKQDQMVDQ